MRLLAENSKKANNSSNSVVDTTDPTYLQSQLLNPKK